MNQGSKRLIHHLDDFGRVVRITWEPAHYTEARSLCANQVHHLIGRAIDLLSVLQLADFTKADQEMETLRDAIADVRPYLRILGDGLKIDEQPPARVAASAKNYANWNRH